MRQINRSADIKVFALLETVVTVLLHGLTFQIVWFHGMQLTTQ